MQLNVVTTKGEATGQVELSELTFGAKFNETLIHQIVTAYLAGARGGTKAQKTRSEVRGGGAKPWRQKGTGRARAGTIRSPLWRSGGATFAASPRDFSQKVNRKMYRAALRSILSELIRQQRLVVVDAVELAAPKTKTLVELLKGLSLDNVLIVTDTLDQNLALAGRNLPNVAIVEAGTLDPVSLVRFEKVLVSVAALKQLEERLG